VIRNPLHPSLRRLALPAFAAAVASLARHGGPMLLHSFLFYVAKALFNGAILLIIIWSVPDGASCPASAVIAANALAWLVGFFAIFAPGGLVVRETCLATLLAQWMLPEGAIAVALAWRLVQIVSEAACSVGNVARGLPGSLKACMLLVPCQL
jgi:glycosyltransferase 2 family protein